jgi:formyltetrahydrofolate hydrolase
MYLAILLTEEFAQDHEWMSISKTEAMARQNVFDGFNTNLMKKFEIESKETISTHEHLEKELENYYKNKFKGDVSIETLEKKYKIFIVEMKLDECYRDEYRVPKKIQDL